MNRIKAKPYRHNDQLADILHYLTAGIPHLFVILLPLLYVGGSVHGVHITCCFFFQCSTELFSNVYSGTK